MTKRRKWTNAERAMLCKNYPDMDWAALDALLVHRSLDAIKSEAARLGLTRTNGVEWSARAKKRGHKTQPVRVRFNSEREHELANSVPVTLRGEILALVGELGAEKALAVLRDLTKRSAQP